MNYLINQLICLFRLLYSASAGHQRMLPWLAALLIVGSCASVPHTGRRQFNVVPDNQINSLALKAFHEVVDKEPKCSDKKFSEIVRRVADRISQAAEAVDKPNFKWEVRVVDKDIPNAFCLPGGKIVVFTGLMPYVKNEAGLAAVIAHEVAHAVARHGAERLSQQLALRGAVSVGGEILKKKDGSLDGSTKLLLGALGMGGTIGVILPYSRVHEFEADRIGQIYMARAGYDPAEAVRLWGRMAKIQKPPIPVWLSTHPADADRVKKLQEFLPDAQKFYGDAPAKYGLGETI